MLLKSIKLLNFRQFIGEQEVLFSTDPQRNVTIILGENGAGKTSFAQAFTWCLYGDTDFADKSVINKELENKMLPGATETVKVTFNLTHNNIDYSIIREQIYSKEFTSKVKPSGTELKIAYKKNGQQEFLKQTEVEGRIKEILPKELSRYFFFDGERITNLSKQIKQGKSKEFSQAVRGLLGLNAFLEAMRHLSPTSKNSVIGSYNDSYDLKSNSNILEYTRNIDEFQRQINEIDERIPIVDDSIQTATEKIQDLQRQIDQFSEGQKLQNEKAKINNELKKKQSVKDNSISTLLKQFNGNTSAYFSITLIKKALENLNSNEITDKVIPDIHERTIKFLIDRGVCICGTKIEFGSEEYKELNTLVDFIPPKSIGTLVGNFVHESEIRIKQSSDLFISMSDQYKMVREFENDIDTLKQELIEIDKKLLDITDVAPLQQSLHTYKQTILSLKNERDQKIQKKGNLETSRDRLISERSELTLRDKNNRKIEIYKAYAQEMYAQINSIYKEKEDDVRTKLGRYINDIFIEIYEGGISLSIDENYNIQVNVKGADGKNYDVETSSAQSISVIFAFISGIIKLARENNQSNDESQMLQAEPYPLVMDAPLSAFDKQRIKNVCDTLPKIAEQVIFFIKDTDGDIAEENMGQVVGKRYLFNKVDELKTTINLR